MSYRPGLHLIASFTTLHISLLYEHSDFMKLMNELITRHQLQKLGEVYHNFQPAGFTGVVCLSESHVSVHTWPEEGRVNLDIYLSNHLRVNDDTVKNLYEALKNYFKGTVEQEQFISR